MWRHSLLLRLVASGFELKMSLSCPKGHVDTCPTNQSLYIAIIRNLLKILFNMWSYVKSNIFFRIWTIILLFLISGRFCIFALVKKSEKIKIHKTVKGIYCSSHLPVMTLFSALSLAVPSCRRLQLLQPHWLVAPSPSRGWFFLHRKTQIRSQKTLGLPSCVYGVRLQSHQRMICNKVHVQKH